MKTRAWILAITLIAVLAGPLLLADAAPRQIVGTVLTVDEEARTFKVVDAGDKQWTFRWNPNTVFLTRPSQGKAVRIAFAAAADGTLEARRVGSRKHSPRRARRP